MPYNIEERIRRVANGNTSTITNEDIENLIIYIATKEFDVTVEEVNALLKLIIGLFTERLLAAGYTEKKVKALRTKFRDAGRRSAPWKPVSSRVPGRPQDGSDGNRINRWLLPVDHKFYATEKIATFVEIKYYLQALSMQNSVEINEEFRNVFTPWLLPHTVETGIYLDPIQLININFQDFIENPRIIQSGHLLPLDRGGIHHPENTFLMLSESNQIQGNHTLRELLDRLKGIIERHNEAEDY